MTAAWPDGRVGGAPPEVTRDFGYIDPMYSRGYHTGTDTVGYPVNHVPEAGVVVFAGYAGSYGNTVLVRTPTGWTHRTAHGARFLVSRGQAVPRAAQLVVQGTTGMSAGVHNHQEVIRPDGVFVDPVAWTRAQNESGSPASSGSRPLTPVGAGDGAENMAREYYRAPDGTIGVVAGARGLVTLDETNAKKLLDIDRLNVENGWTPNVKVPRWGDEASFFNVDWDGWRLLAALYPSRS